MPKFQKWQEWAIPIAILAGLFVILTPLPTGVIDFLLAANMILAIMILSAALLAKSSTELTVFPAILLVSTLGRLVLNISTTRLILSNATTSQDLAAGGLIKSFGEYVIGDQVFVGLVIFAIIFIIQFVVVTKGSSRISEVAARFALDGMPGKQMAIDADLKSKITTPAQAKVQRDQLQEKADFLGAMDGAGRFVRGDAVAGLIITLVNIIGGLTIGLLGGMEFSTAVDVYTILTIGDGLASQLPAFLIAIAAGVLMARGSRTSSVSQDMMTQVGADPRVFYIAGIGAIALILAGMPAVPLFLIGGACFFAGFQRQSKLQAEHDAEAQRSAQAETEAANNRKKDDNFEAILRVDPIEIRLGVSLVCLADPKQGGTLFHDVSELRKSILQTFGFVLPKIRITDDITLKENRFRILIHGECVSESEIIPEQLLAVDNGNTKAPIHGRKSDSQLGTGTWIDRNQEHRAEYFRYQVFEPAQVIVEMLRRQTIQHSSDLFTRDCAGQLVDEVKKHAPLVVEELIPTRMSLSDVQQVLKKLLEERVSIRQLALILETLGDYSPHTNQIDELVEHVRQKLSRAICSRICHKKNLEYLALEKSLESRLISQKCNVPHPDGDLQFGKQDFQWFAKEIEQQKQPGKELVVIVDQRIRRWFRDKIDFCLHDVTVLSHEEVCSDFELHKIGEVSLQPAIRNEVA